MAKAFVSFLKGFLFALLALGAMPFLLVKIIVNEVFTLF